MEECESAFEFGGEDARERVDEVTLATQAHDRAYVLECLDGQAVAFLVARVVREFGLEMRVRVRTTDKHARVEAYGHEGRDCQRQLPVDEERHCDGKAHACCRL